MNNVIFKHATKESVLNGPSKEIQNGQILVETDSSYLYADLNGKRHTISEENFTSEEKEKLSNVQENATNNIGTITGVTANNGLVGGGTSGDIEVSLPNKGIAGSYKSVTTDAQGRVVEGSNPTTRAEFGITDAAPLDTTLSESEPSTVLPTTGSSSIVSKIQSLRNNTKALFSYFTSGKAHQAYNADNVTWNGVSGKPSTLEGYGINDAAPSSHVGSIGTAQHGMADGTNSGFSQSNYSNADQQKLQEIESQAQVNKIDTIEVNGQTQPITDKKVEIAVPVSVSQLNNDSGYIKDAGVVGVKGSKESEYRVGNVNLSSGDIGAESSDNKGIANGYASLDIEGKVPMSQIPDTILGQMTHAGEFDASTSIAALTTSGKSILNTSSDAITLTNDTSSITGYSANQGNYYIVSKDGTFAEISFNIGDWVVANETGWSAIHNTDAVTGVKGSEESQYRIGNINITKDNIGLGNVTNVAQAPETHIGTGGDQHALANGTPGFSTNDFTSTEKQKLSGIAEGATANQGTLTRVVGNNPISTITNEDEVIINHSNIQQEPPSTLNTSPNFGDTVKVMTDAGIDGQGHHRQKIFSDIRFPNTPGTSTTSGIVKLGSEGGAARFGNYIDVNASHIATAEEGGIGSSLSGLYLVLAPDNPNNRYSVSLSSEFFVPSPIFESEGAGFVYMYDRINSGLWSGTDIVREQITTGQLQLVSGGQETIMYQHMIKILDTVFLSCTISVAGAAGVLKIADASFFPKVIADQPLWWSISTAFHYIQGTISIDQDHLIYNLEEEISDLIVFTTMWQTAS